ncbi:ATPase, T2SS/T4P/T4SS family [Solibacillus silvestris]
MFEKFSTKAKESKIDFTEIRPHLKGIEDSLINGHAQLIIQSITDPIARKEIKEIIRLNHKTVTQDNEDIIEYVTSEIVGTGIIEELIRENSDITDIAYDGWELEVEGIQTYYRIKEDSINENYVQKIITKFAAAMGKDFSAKNPILNGVVGNIRINAVHNQNSLGGTTFSLRIVRPYLALNQESFKKFAPAMLWELMRAQVFLYQNALIGGITGTGKTELQKVFVQHTRNNHEKIGMIQDVPETFAKEMNPDKTIYEWTTGNGVTHSDLIAAAMRNNFRWINVTEIIDAAAYALYEAALSGHAVVTTLHSKDVYKLPKRMVQLAKQAPQVASTNEKELLNEIEDLFDSGWFIKKEVFQDTMYRYLHQVAFYSPDNHHLVFEQEFKQGVLYWRTHELPESFLKECDRVGFNLEWEATEGRINLVGEGVMQV